MYQLLYSVYIPIKWALFHPWFLNQSNCVTIIPCTVEWCRCDHSTLFSEHSVQVLQFIPDSFQLYLGQNSAVCHFSPDLSVAHPCNLTVCLFGMDWVARWVLPSGHTTVSECWKLIYRICCPLLFVDSLAMYCTGGFVGPSRICPWFSIELSSY